MAAPYNPPVKNEDFAVRICLADMSTPGSLKSSPTIAAGDFKVDKDGGGLTNLSTLPAVDPAASVLVSIPTTTCGRYVPYLLWLQLSVRRAAAARCR